MRIYIDYNAETPDGRFFARTSRLEHQARIGEAVQTHDEDSNRLVMVVDEIDEDRGLVYLRPDWSTWLDGDSAHLITASGQIRLDRGLVGLLQTRVPAVNGLFFGTTATVHFSGPTIRTFDDGKPLSLTVAHRPASAPA